MPIPVKPIHIGCSGWNYASWRGGEFYPKGCPPSRWLEHYATVFDTVEVNSTFYRLAKQEAVKRWTEQTPPQFVFALKASRYLTHIKRLTDLDQGIRRFYERIEPLVGTPKLGPIVWQLPERFQRDDERLASALQALPPGRHCFEFRHPSWFVADVYAQLRRDGVALVIGDHPSRPFMAHELTAAWTLVRLHHVHRGRGGNYSETELREWADRIRRWRRAVEVLVYFNHDWQGYAVRNGLRLKRLLDG